ncbi:Rrf2 family transcriptional regulator, partial [Eubacteriales bacterium OttesenSCG-928-N14]|nr:Rrf2 family transcriptional regulator [Eubacteriales bacterium OttesenSCG-928-N14]
MRISKEVDYALRITLYLSTKKEGEITGASEIAEKMGIPERFNLKILRSLSIGNVTKSYR